jgi:mannose-6-phosphate isomerase-like protein (cupin superfamily)
MAFKNKEISNPLTGQSIRFLQTSKDTSGVLLEMESTYSGTSLEPIAHYHPFQEEDFYVIEGEVTVRLNGKERTLKRGDHVHIPRNAVHSMWNRSGSKATVNWKVIPALGTEHLLETVMGLALDGKTDKNGKPGILQAALMMNTFSNVFRIARPPYPVQWIIFMILAPFAYLSGYRPTYRNYLD